MSDAIANFVCVLTPCRPDLPWTRTPEEMAVFGEHVAYLKRLFAEGSLLHAGVSFERNVDVFAVMVLRAKDIGTARALVDADPAIAAGYLIPKVNVYEVFLNNLPDERGESTAN